MALKPLGGELTQREIVELAINNALPNIDDLPARSEYEITQSQLDSELSDIAATASDIRPVVRGQPSAVSVSESQSAMDAVSASTTAMDAVSTSSTAMDAVSTSSTAMDAVSASQTARDAVNASDLAYDTIAAVEMAIGKFVAGSAGLTPGDYADIAAVASSQTAMDAVSTSSTAMDAVSASALAVDAVTGSAMALWKFLSSAEVNTSFWSNDTGTEAFWDHNGDLADVYWQLDADSRHGGQALYLDCDQFPPGGDYVSYIIDLSNASSLTVYEKTVNARGTNFEVIVGGSTEFSASNNNNLYEGRTVDVSTYDGNTTVEIGLAGSDSSGRETLVSDIQLS